MVHAEDGEDSIDRELDCPALSLHAVEDIGLFHVLDSAIANVNAKNLRFGGLGVKLGNNLLSLETGVFGEGSTVVTIFSMVGAGGVLMRAGACLALSS